MQRHFRRNRNRQKEIIPVTVCVTAMCNGNTIIGASDRMLTAGDIQFEPQQTKIFPLTTSIAVMLAGDSSMQAEVLQCVQSDVNKRIDSEPQKWWNVSDIAELYSQHYNKVRFKKAERAILAPLGLDGDTFIARQREMEPSLVRQITEELINFDTPFTSTIFAGIDSGGPHIYVANCSNITCQDNVGFASIGVGVWHASSQLMFSGHTRLKPFPETLLTVYSAKKRAEVAPGVGEATDMFVVGPSLGSYTVIGEHVLSRLAKIYADEQKRERKASINAREKVNQYVDEIIQATTAKSQEVIQPDGGRETSPDEEAHSASAP